MTHERDITMKTSDLMIGDWVMSIHPAVPRPIRVTEIGGNDIGYKNGILSISFLEPIPITHEILEKNGFESTENIFGLKTYKLNDDFILEDRGEEKCLCRNCYKMQTSPTFWVCNIEHVHELQHALRLCGIAKEIEL